MRWVGVREAVCARVEVGETVELENAYNSSMHPDTLVSRHNLVDVLDRKGNYAAAEKMQREALLLCERVLGKEHSSTLTSMSNLAGVLDKQ